MLTRCPHCQTDFRVTPEQLKARQGQVRCGACRGVFSALDSLADEVPVVIGPVALPVEAPPEPIPATEPEAEPEAEAEPATSATPEDDSPPPPEEPASIDEESRRWPHLPMSGDAADTEAAASTATAEAPVAAVWETVAETPQPRRWPWIAGLVVLLALAGGQLLTLFRVELAVLAPELRPALVAGCELLGCALPHPRKAELIGIEASGLIPAEATGAAGAGRLLLTATLKNRAPFDQEYPHLELTLTDTQDNALLRKVLAPVDYLPADHAVGAGFATRSTVAVRLLLETSGIPAVGYRLYLFYP